MFTVACHRRFDPRDVKGIVACLDASNIRGLVDTDPISTWPDSSGNARDYAGSGSTRPLYRTGIVNGHPTVRFDGTDDYMNRVDTGYPSAQAHSVVVVACASITSMSTGDERAVHTFGNRSTDQLSCILLRDDGTNEGLIWTQYGSTTSTLTVSPLNQWFVGSIITTGVGVSVPLTVTLHTASGSSSTTPSPNHNVALGGGAYVGQHGGSGGYFAGDIMFAAVWNRQITSSERILVSQFVARRVGVAVNS